MKIIVSNIIAFEKIFLSYGKRKILNNINFDIDTKNILYFNNRNENIS